MIRAAAIALALAAAPALAEEGKFAAGSEAKDWGLTGQEMALFRAEVVDVLCTLTGDCPANCGDGKRQMGLIRAADGALVMVAKNTQSSFNGGATDLAPYCGKMVEVDGLLVGGDEIYEGAPKVYQVQRIREEGGEWRKANRWTKEWAKQNPEAKGKGPWFRRDPRIAREIEEDGYLGLGPEADVTFIREWY